MIQKIKKKNNISFIVPVLDYSPASQYNIKTLIEDLREIEGELIIIFNNQEVANELRKEERINHSAVMSCNVGVSRAWNIGLNICRTPIAFILNSDLHIKRGSIIKIIEYLDRLPDAAMIGPQGSFFNFHTLKDYMYFDKNTFDSPQEVDAVSGFLFALNMDLLDQKGIKFDNQYTPCYMEEWDIGLQIKRAGLKSYIVPAIEYDHEWSGSIRAYKQIKFYDQQLTPNEILLKNQKKFKEKWTEIAKNLDDTFLQSKLKEFALGQVEKNIISNNISQAASILQNIFHEFGEDLNSLSRMVQFQFQLNNLAEAKKYLIKILNLDKTNEEALIVLKKIEELE
ncbi:glycosyltransferase [Polynucleobacter paneuropaeus]|nr:glycosyltransferase [Polynucleobacter paneuropaeus]QWD09311.1 glycosyltransferase [Polynucleobacter paneuropaeus]QWD46078.1 glycosyltransferase [Polynucleobacter paneuropaeus]